MSSLKDLKRVVAAIGIFLFVVVIIVDEVKVLQINEKKCVSLQTPVISGYYCSDNVYMAKEVVEMRHALPWSLVGTEHYYLVATEDSICPMLIRASDSWWSDNFDAEGMNEAGVAIFGLVREHQSEVSEIVVNLNEQLSDVVINDAIYVDVRFRDIAYSRITEGAFVIILFLVMLFLYILPQYKTSDALQMIQILLYIPIIVLFLRIMM